MHLTLSAPSRNRRERKSLRAESPEVRFAVIVHPAWGGTVRVPISPIRNPDLARRVAHLLNLFLSLDDVRYEAAPQWAFALRDRLAGRLKGVRVEVVPVPLALARGAI